MKVPNKPDAVNPAMALRFAVEDHWRRVSDLERWPTWHCVKACPIVLICISGLLYGCASPDFAAAEARRIEELRQRDPAAYEVERDQRRRYPESLEEYQRRVDDYRRQISK